MITLKEKKRGKFRYKLRFVEIEVPIPGEEPFASPKVVFEALKESFNPIQEELYLIVVNSKNLVLQQFLIAKGAFNTVSSSASDVFRPLLMIGGSRFFLVHNHPSGSPEPSEEDIRYTNRIKKAADLMGLNFLDHLIFTNLSFYSFKENGYFN